MFVLKLVLIVNRITCAYTHHTIAMPPTAATRRSTPAVTPTGTATVSTATPCATTTGGEETAVADVLVTCPTVVGISERSDDRVAEISTDDDAGGSGEKPCSISVAVTLSLK